MVAKNMSRTWEGKQDLKNEFVNLRRSISNICFKQVKWPISIHMCAPISELPPKIGVNSPLKIFWALAPPEKKLKRGGK